MAREGMMGGVPTAGMGLDGLQGPFQPNHAVSLQTTRLLKEMLCTVPGLGFVTRDCWHGNIAVRFC